MKPFITITAGLATLVSVASARVAGFDISHYQPNVNFIHAYSSGARFVIIKATEGTKDIDSSFSQHYSGATKAKLIRGAYHVAYPGESSGAAQAGYFLAHGGGWQPDGITLPGMVELDAASGPRTCYGLNVATMVKWIDSFLDAYHSATGRWPLIYTRISWWKQCTGNDASIAKKSPLVIARYSSNPGELPAGWGLCTIWQNSDRTAWGGSSDIFNGDLAQLQKFAKGEPDNTST